MDLTDPFSLRFDAARVFQLTGAAAPRSLLTRRAATESGTAVCADRARALAWALSSNSAAHPGDPSRFRWGLVAPAVRLGHNSTFPRDRNNGALWGGVGAGLSAAAGLRVHWRWFDVQLAPQFLTEQNAEFATIPAAFEARSQWGNPYHPGIDWYQRPGESSRTVVDPGQSFARATLGPVSAGFGTDNVWIGPARMYPILISATAAGFPHAFVETPHPVATPIGDIEVRALWGQLSESEVFDGDPENDDRIFAALVAAWSPRWIPGFSVGAARVYHETMIPGEFDFAHYLGTIVDPSFLGSGGGNRRGGNALAGIYARWVFPAAGFEVYGEWTREDTPWDLRDALSEPDWTQAYAIGFQHFLGEPSASRAVRWYGEFVHLGESAPVRSGRGLFSYYTHSVVEQGHTQRGQLLGAWTGPGSDAQTMGADLLYARGLTGIWVERNRFDTDTYYRRYADRFGESRHDVEIAAGLRQLYSISGVEVEGSVSYGMRYNRNFIGLDMEDPEARTDGNWSLNLRTQWFPPLARPVW